MANILSPLTILADIDRVRQRIDHGQPAFETEVAAAANFLCFSDPSARHGYWGLFTQFASSALARTGEAADKDAKAFFRDFFANTRFEDVERLIRRDRHLWNMCQHVIQRDGSWIACDVLFDGIFFAGGHTVGVQDYCLGQHSDRVQSEKAIARDYQRGMARTESSKPSAVNFFFRNERVLDIMSALVKTYGFAEATGFALNDANFYIARSSAYFDITLLRQLGPIDFAYFDPSPSSLYNQKLLNCESMVEAIYVAKSGTASMEACCTIMATIFSDVLARSAAESANADFHLVVTLELEKRVWVEQIDAITQLMSAICGRVERLHVTLCGMTGTTSGSSLYTNERLAILNNIHDVEEKCLLEWKALLGAKLSFSHLSGLSLDRKISQISGADFFVAPAGTAAAIVSFADIPGVCYSHPDLISVFMSHIAAFPKAVYVCQDGARGTDLSGGMAKYSWARTDSMSYSIAPETFLNSCLPELRRARRPIIF